MSKKWKQVAEYYLVYRSKLKSRLLSKQKMGGKWLMGWLGKQVGDVLKAKF